MITVPIFIIFLAIGWYNMIFAEKISKIWFGVVWFALLLYIIAAGVLGGI